MFQTSKLINNFNNTVAFKYQTERTYTPLNATSFYAVSFIT